MIATAYAALWVFVFALPWENVFVIPGLGTISKLMGLVAFAFAALAGLFTGRLRHLNRFHVAALFFVILAGFSVFRAAYTDAAIIKFKTYVQLFAVLWIIWELAPDVRRQRGLLTAYVFGSYVGALLTIIVRPAVHHTTTRFAAEGFDANDLGMTLALAIPMAWYLGMTYSHAFLQWACRGYLLIGVVAIGLTGSRGAMLATMFALLIVPLTMTRLSATKKMAAILLVFGVGAVSIFFIPEKSFQRFSTTKEEVEEGTLNGRLQIWRAGVHAFVERPVLGWGTGSFDRTIVPWYGRPRAPHNSYLCILVEQGVVGFLVWLTMYFLVFSQVLRLPSMERRFALVLLGTMAVAMLPLGWDDRKPVWFIAGALVAFCVAIRTHQFGTRAISQPAPVKVIPESPAARAARRPVSVLARAFPPSRSPRQPRGSSGKDA
jgi:O-antigen ligase